MSTRTRSKNIDKNDKTSMSAQYFCQNRLLRGGNRPTASGRMPAVHMDQPIPSQRWSNTPNRHGTGERGDDESTSSNSDTTSSENESIGMSQSYNKRRRSSSMRPSSSASNKISERWMNSMEESQGSPRTQPLDEQMIQRLLAVLNSMVVVNGSVVGYPTFAVRPIDFLEVLKRNLEEAAPQITVERCCLYGGAATYCMCPTYCHIFNDIDLVIHVNFDKMNMHIHLDRIKSIVLGSLREVVKHCLRTHPLQTQVDNLDDATLTVAYIQKMYKHTPNDGVRDIWSLFSFRNYEGRNLEVKFVHTLERCYKFSIDAWQIDLSTNFLRQVQEFWSKRRAIHDLSTNVECKYPDFHRALQDVSEKVIRVIKPESVRGGCFLRYLHLLNQGYLPALHGKEQLKQEYHMLSRFCKDFPSQYLQIKQISTYMTTHCPKRHPYLRDLSDKIFNIVENFSWEKGLDSEPLADFLSRKHAFLSLKNTVDEATKKESEREAEAWNHPSWKPIRGPPRRNGRRFRDPDFASAVYHSAQRRIYRQ